MSLTNGPNLGLLVNGNNGEGHYTELMKQFRWIDWHGQPWVINMTTATPPGSPSDGDAYLVATGGTGVWSGKDGQVARYSTILTAWEFGVPKNGWRVWDRNTALPYHYNGSAWASDLASVLGALVYKGAKNMASDPSLPAPAAGNLGWYYVVSVASTGDVSYANLPASRSYSVGDTLISHGSGTWDVVDGDKPETLATPGTLVLRDAKGGFAAAAVSLADWTDGFISSHALTLGTSHGGDGLSVGSSGGGDGVKVSAAGGTAIRALSDSAVYLGASSGDGSYVFSAGNLFSDGYGNSHPNGGMFFGLINPSTGGTGEGVYIQIDFSGVDTHTGSAFHAVNTSIGDYQGFSFLADRGGSAQTSIDFNGHAMFLNAIGVGALPAWPLDVTANASATGGVAYGARLEQTVLASADADYLYGFEVNPTFDDAGHASVRHFIQRWRVAGAEKASLDENGKFTMASLALTGLLISYQGVATVGGGIPAEIAYVDATAQGAAIAATTIYAVPASGAGMYRISWAAKVTRAATTSSVLGGTSLGLQVVYTDADDSVVATTQANLSGATNAGNTTASTAEGVIIVNAKASTNIQYKIGYTSVGGTPMQYNLHVKVEAMG